ncbi:MAG: sensor histidine kinase [Clostridium sp.]
MSNVVFIIGIILIICNIIFFIKVKKDVSLFTEKISFIIEKIINNEEVSFEVNKETILSKLEFKLKRLYDSLKVKEKNTLKDKENLQSLVGDISHQVKTPLSNINLYTETLLNRDIEKEKRDIFLGYIVEEEKKLDFLMDSLIKSSRLESGVIKVKKEKVNLKSILEETISMAKREANLKNIDFYLDIKEVFVLGDSKWLKEALLNIIENGVKYSKENSKLEIEVLKGEIFSYVNIKDYGIGINKENINNVFKRFFREEEVYEIKGVGIGLYLARYIVEEFGGFIKVESEKGKGSIFSVYLLNITTL